MHENYTMVAKTLFGFEPLLAEELKKLGAMEIVSGHRMVSFKGDKGFMYKMNVALRTAIKILKPIYEFRVRNEQDLYRGIYRYDWTKLLSAEQTLAIDVTLASQNFNHSHYLAMKAKDAIVDQFRDKFGKRPSVDLESPDLRINLHITDDFCTVSLDSSGTSLHQRGYKTATNIAPINEVLAAGLLLMSGWDGQCDFLDPMCGSGTILVEAAMIACNIPANIHRKAFAFEKWQDFDPDLFEAVKASLMKKTRDFYFTIKGSDRVISAVTKAKANVENAGLEDFIEIEQSNFFESKKATERHLHILFNPPYGERLSIDMENFYKSIGDTLKQNYPDTEAWLVTSNLDALKYVGLKPAKRIIVMNSQLESRLVKYDIYAGTKRTVFKE